jgi:H/ACA ribonucleoprotein complex subunit 3
VTTMALRRCTGCGRYTLEVTCPDCDGPTERAGPARYSPEDHYGTYRRALKRKTDHQGDQAEEE